MFMYIIYYLFIEIFFFLLFFFLQIPLERMRVDGGAEHAAPNDTL